MYQLALNLDRKNMMIIGAVVGGLLLLGICLRVLLMPRHDKHVLGDYVQRHHPGWRVVDIRWKVFGPGWFGDLSRIYLVTYLGAGSARKTRYFKVGLFSGVYETMAWPLHELEEPLDKRRADDARRRSAKTAAEPSSRFIRREARQAQPAPRPDR